MKETLRRQNSIPFLAKFLLLLYQIYLLVISRKLWWMNQKRLEFWWETHNRPVIVTVHATPCAIPPYNSNSIGCSDYDCLWFFSVSPSKCGYRLGRLPSNRSCLPPSKSISKHNPSSSSDVRVSKLSDVWEPTTYINTYTIVPIISPLTWAWSQKQSSVRVIVTPLLHCQPPGKTSLHSVAIKWSYKLNCKL
jgi:hypothetical protein